MTILLTNPASQVGGKLVKTPLYANPKQTYKTSKSHSSPAVLLCRMTQQYEVLLFPSNLKGKRTATCIPYSRDDYLRVRGTITNTHTASHDRPVFPRTAIPVTRPQLPFWPEPNCYAMLALLRSHSNPPPIPAAEAAAARVRTTAVRGTVDVIP